jgi:anti-sigma regulatory factor (Ser/Thr protein kinase)
MATETFQRHSLSLESSAGASGKVSAWARALAEQAGLAHPRIDAIDLCVVELVTNIVNHSYRGAPGEIRVELGLGHGGAVLTILDHGPAFDPLSVPAPALAGSLEEAQVGGFGIHLVRTSADACEYDRREGRNVFTARFGSPGG